ncbi:hypothetical protein VNO80_31199 [Phaseolus coccineus]|uniref:Ty3 transposon capsid-like protein domain-containing protein n=1 Tax=Phaseolus coccineus TaxID=3886 RepID=A0AAN9LB64_PHACN
MQSHPGGDLLPDSLALSTTCHPVHGPRGQRLLTSSTTDDRPDQMATAIQQQNAAMAQNHQAAMHHWETAWSAETASHVGQPQEQMGLTEFMRHNPPKFSGNATPDQADQWIRELEKIFRATSCPEEKKLVFATYLLSGEAEFWWMGAQ